MVKVHVYRNATHTDQYLHFSSHKLGVICTLYDRCDIVTEKADAANEIDNVNRDLGACGYPSWSFKRVREKMDKQEQKNNRKTSKMESKGKSTKTRVTLPYIRGVSEALSWVFHRHGMAMSIKPHLTLKRMLVHPKDKRTPQENLGVVYPVPCKNCKDIYTGETERRYRVRKKEQKRNIKTLEEKKYTRSRKKDSQTELHPSAITDHVAKENHTIDWEGVKFPARTPATWEYNQYMGNYF